MTPIPLAELRLRFSHHRSALWWLALLYRRPREFAVAVPSLKLEGSLIGLRLLLHAMPWVFLTALLGRLSLVYDTSLPFSLSNADFASLLPVLKKTAFGVAFGVAGGVASGVAVGVASGVAGGVASGVAVGVAFGVAFGVTAGVALVISSLRVYYFPLHIFSVWPRPRGNCYPQHPVAWDDLCSLPFPGLDRLLVAYAQTNPAAAKAEIERLIDHYPSQRMQALKARAILIAQSTRADPVLSRLDLAIAGLPEGAKGFPRDVPKLKEQVAAIAQLQRRLDTVEIPAFREPLAAQLARAIEDFRGAVAGLRYPLNTAFRDAALGWLEAAKRQQAEASRLLSATPVTQVFRAGDPVDRAEEAFVPRLGAIEDLQGQLTLATGCPGLLLYGRRRMGKSTLLHNLQPFLPASIRVASVSMQDPRASTSLTSWIQWIAKAAIGPESPVPEDLSGFFDALTRFNQGLDAQAQRVIIAVDEYENIDSKLGEGIFPNDLLDTLRESIQRHRRIVWLFSGSHALAELQHAEWSSYFVSLRTVELGPFSEAETRLLLTEPLHHSMLWPQGDPARPHFDAAFWGEGGIERIHAEAAGWPHLVQLIAERAVYLVNRRGQRACNPAILEEAIATAVVSGDAVLRQLVRDDCRLDGEWDYLKAFRTRDTQVPPEDEALYQSLRRRLMVANDGGGQWRMRVPLMRRWLRERG
ncbi:MAG: AAA family ATPase [Methylococcales bacterium]